MCSPNYSWIYQTFNSIMYTFMNKHIIPPISLKLLVTKLGGLDLFTVQQQVLYYRWLQPKNRFKTRSLCIPLLCLNGHKGVAKNTRYHTSDMILRCMDGIPLKSFVIFQLNV